ncbi:hypothetical protein DFH07DRAFT_954755 [Mycena maculata]|uniref:Uncharacterized protein n=1 Tax=Mycena maculata TaxID=230809 RepID=A0AAD7JQ74_9AGAR|nr:hypothetical protein DFH07DRAFT_954755 [Mycena maculata]
MLDPVDIVVYPIASIIVAVTVTMPIAWWYMTAMPLLGVLTHYCTNYPSTLTSIIARVYRIEGLGGFYKGIMPSMLTTFINLLIHFLPKLRARTLTRAILPALLLIPLHTLTTRAITTPHALSALAPRAALHALLTSAERAAPGITPAALLAAATPHLLLPRPLAAALTTALRILATRLTLLPPAAKAIYWNASTYADERRPDLARLQMDLDYAHAGKDVLAVHEGPAALFRGWELAALRWWVFG